MRRPFGRNQIADDQAADASDQFATGGTRPRRTTHAGGPPGVADALGDVRRCWASGSIEDDWWAEFAGGEPVAEAAVSDTDQLAAEKTRLADEVDRLSQQLDAAQRQLAAQRTQSADGANAAIQEREEEIRRLERQLTEAAARVGSLETSLTEALHQLRQLQLQQTQSADAWQRERAALLERSNSLLAQSQQANEELQRRLAEQQEQVESDPDQQPDGAEVIRWTKQLEQLQAKLESADQQWSELHERQRRLTEEETLARESMGEQEQQLRAEIGDLKSELARCEAVMREQREEARRQQTLTAEQQQRQRAAIQRCEDNVSHLRHLLKANSERLTSVDVRLSSVQVDLRAPLAPPQEEDGPSGEREDGAADNATPSEPPEPHIWPALSERLRQRSDPATTSTTKCDEDLPDQADSAVEVRDASDVAEQEPADSATELAHVVCGDDRWEREDLDVDLVVRLSHLKGQKTLRRRLVEIGLVVAAVVSIGLIAWNWKSIAPFLGSHDADIRRDRGDRSW